MDKDRLSKLRELESELHDALLTAEPRAIAGIAKQYRETLAEIAELEGADDDGDAIAELIAKHAG